MPRGELYINGKDAYTEWGVSMTDAGLSALMTPAANKSPIENKGRLMDGKQVNMAATRTDERTLSLPISLTAPTKSAFFTRYEAFCAELAKGQLNISTKYQPNVLYRTYYISCQQFSQFVREMASFSLRICEPDPTNRQKA